MEISEQQIALIRAWAQTKPRIAAITLFGSRAKGTHRPNSDVDLGILVTENDDYTRMTVWHFERDAWSQHLSQELGVKADVNFIDLIETSQIRRYCQEAGNILIYEKDANGISGAV